MIRIISVSGGKDSTALWLWALRNPDIWPIIPLFCDTQWESDITYEYLDYLDLELGPICGPLRRVMSEGFEARTRRGGTFPSRVRKWCSPELKVQMCAEELDRIRDEYADDVEVVVGFRREESIKRADPLLTPEREWNDDYDCEVWRPILDWTLADVIAEHHRAGVALNPLYLMGAERVGCWPCIHARKSEIRLIGETDPDRIERVAALEREIGQTMFALEESRKGKAKGADRKVIPTGIHEMVLWSKTKRGGKEIAEIAAPSGCQRWGICEHISK